MPDGTHGQPGLVSHLPQGRPFQPVHGDDPEDRFNNFLAPGFGINNFGHPYFLARSCSHDGVAHQSRRGQSAVPTVG